MRRDQRVGRDVEQYGGHRSGRAGRAVTAHTNPLSARPPRASTLIRWLVARAFEHSTSNPALDRCHDSEAGRHDRVLDLVAVIDDDEARLIGNGAPEMKTIDVPVQSALISYVPVPGVSRLGGLICPCELLTSVNPPWPLYVRRPVPTNDSVSAGLAGAGRMPELRRP